MLTVCFGFGQVKRSLQSGIFFDFAFGKTNNNCARQRLSANNAVRTASIILT